MTDISEVAASPGFGPPPTTAKPPIEEEAALKLELVDTGWLSTLPMLPPIDLELPPTVAGFLKRKLFGLGDWLPEVGFDCWRERTGEEGAGFI